MTISDKNNPESADKVNHGPLLSALATLLTPLVRILMRAGVSSDAATDVLQHTFVKVAEQDFALANKKQSDSRISILTGMSRKQVARYRKREQLISSAENAHRNRVERVITGWVREPMFLDEKNDPKPLPMEGEVSFTTLVNMFAGDVPVRAVVDELLRIGNIAMTESGNLRLTVRGYLPKPLSAGSLNLLGTHTADFLTTMDHNLTAGEREALQFQAQVTYNEIPVEHTDAFNEYSARLAHRLLEDLDRWLAARQQPDAAEQETLRLGFGTYAIKGPNEELEK